MTLGLAVADDVIYLAIESEGLPATGPGPVRLVLQSKIIDLQTAPTFSVLAAGGLEHWCHVAARYLPKQTLAECAIEVGQLLDDCMGPANQAFGLLCGYDEGAPRCYRVDRPQHQQTTLAGPLELDQPQQIGMYAAEALALAGKVIPTRGCLHGIVQAIETLVVKPWLRRPIHVRVIRPGT